MQVVRVMQIKEMANMCSMAALKEARSDVYSHHSFCLNQNKKAFWHYYAKVMI